MKEKVLLVFSFVSMALILVASPSLIAKKNKESFKAELKGFSAKSEFHAKSARAFVVPNATAENTRILHIEIFDKKIDGKAICQFNSNNDDLQDSFQFAFYLVEKKDTEKKKSLYSIDQDLENNLRFTPFEDAISRAYYIYKYDKQKKSYEKFPVAKRVFDLRNGVILLSHNKIVKEATGKMGFLNSNNVLSDKLKIIVQRLEGQKNEKSVVVSGEVTAVICPL